ncbi:hypothetical protein PISMIDRAFT_678512 [Pisolithus microcarpus 441]|uniref:Uncharacterized protein n=1 Tax=Pisolithus microcarpus 441 TaxID=765257 RepID=A0A0C9Z4N9_9AGAM|nr:hypothetical protein PISMIDRAFT_678512 [Pisolithus microcarpus 441]
MPSKCASGEGQPTFEFRQEKRANRLTVKMGNILRFTDEKRANRLLVEMGNIPYELQPRSADRANKQYRGVLSRETDQQPTA